MKNDYSGFWVKDPEFYKSLLTLAFPIVLQNMLIAGIIFADNAMVGPLGGAAISGLYFGTLVMTVLQILIFGIEGGVLVLAAQYWGKRDFPNIKNVVSIASRITFCFTMIFSLVTFFFPEMLMGLIAPNNPEAAAESVKYLRIVSPAYPLLCIIEMLIISMRAVECSKAGFYTSALALVMNVFLNWVFIYGHFGIPAMGVSGAAAATVISFVCQFILIVYFVLKVDRNLHLRLIDFLRWNNLIFKDFIKYGLPIFLGQLVWAVNQYAQSFFVGRMPPDAAAAASAVFMLQRLLWMGVWGLAAATGILVSKAVGKNEFDKVKQYAKTMQAVFFSLGVLVSCIILCFSGWFLKLYNFNVETLKFAEQFFLVLALIAIGTGYQAPSLFGLVKSGGDTSFVFKNDTFWVLFWIIPLTSVAHFLYHAPAWVIFFLLNSDQITKCFVALVKINSFNWMKNLTRDKIKRAAHK